MAMATSVAVVEKATVTLEVEDSAVSGTAQRSTVMAWAMSAVARDTVAVEEKAPVVEVLAAAAAAKAMQVTGSTGRTMLQTAQY